MEEVYTCKEVAKLLKIREEQVRNLLRRGYFKGFKVGHYWRIPESEIKKLTEGVLSSIDWHKELLAKL